MAKDKIELLIEAKNRTGKSFDNVNKNLSSLEKNAKRVKAIGNVFTGLVAGVAIISTFRSVIEKTREQEAALAQLEARLESTGGISGKTSEELQKMASGLQKVTTFGDEAILSMQSMLLTFTNIKGDRFDEATESILDMAVALKTDLKSASIQVGKALNDPIKGVSALSRSGVQFSKDQESMIKSLVETGEAAKAQGIILDELKTQFGGAARAAADTFGGALDQLSNAFGDLLEADGDSLVSAKKEIQELTKLMQDPATKAAMDDLTAGAVSFSGALAQLATWSVQAAKGLGENLAQGVLKLQGVSDELIYFKDNVQLLREQIEKNNEQAEQYGGAYAQNLREENKELQEQIDLLTGVKQVTEEVKEVQELLTADDLDIFGGVEAGNNEFSQSTQEIIDKLNEERRVLKLSAKEQFIYNQVKKAGTDATYEEINAIKKAAESLFEEKEAIKQAKKLTNELNKAKKEQQKINKESSRSASASVFGKQADEAEELTKKTEEATKAQRQWLSASSQGGKDTSDAFSNDDLFSLTPELARQRAVEIKAAMQQEFDANPVQVKVTTPGPKAITNNTPSTSSSFSKVGGLNSGLSSVSISREALKQGSKS